MRLFRGLWTILFVAAAALAGNWFGGTLRYFLTGKNVQSTSYHHTTQTGRQIRNIPVITKFYPALFFGLLGKPAWIFVFLGGIYTGALVPDRLEGAFWNRFEQFLLK